MFDEQLSKTQVSDTTVESSDTPSNKPAHSGRLMQTVRALCVGILVATAVPSPAHSATPKKQVDCTLAADPEKECALRDPMAVLDLIPQNKRKPWAKEYLRAAIKNNVQALLSRAPKFADQPYYKTIVVEAFQWASKNDPAVVFVFPKLLDEIYFDELNSASKQKIRVDAARLLVKTYPMMAITHWEDFKKIPGAGKLLKEAATQIPWFVFEEKEAVQNCDYASELYLGASLGDPILALKESDTIYQYDWAKDVLFPAMRKHPELALATLSNLKYWVFYKPYFMELNKQFPGIALKDPTLILENDEWAKDELFSEMRKNPEIALEHLSKLKEWRQYRDYFKELSEVLSKKNPRYLLDHSDQIPPSIHKTMLVDRLKARFGE